MPNNCAGQKSGDRASWQAEYRTIHSAEELSELVRQLAAQTTASLHVMPTGHTLTTSDIAGIALAWTPGQAWYLPMGTRAANTVPPHPALSHEGREDLEAFDREMALAALRPFLESAAMAKISRDVKHDTILLERAGITPAGMAFDTMLASYLLDAGERNHTLRELSERYLDHSMAKDGPGGRGAAVRCPLPTRIRCPRDMRPAKKWTSFCGWRRF